ncbi:MAG: hypothetical protein E4H01_11085 [Lysobacterales bacterium]|nr:MAG: hypothetical protein E4H01_11085 [Xanthomonadales bacterium]
MILLMVLLFAASARLAVATELQPAKPEPVFVSDDHREWRFRVYLDDKEIGYHHFFLADQGGTQTVHSIADFEYKLLFVKLYEYQHQNSESWQGDCLQSIESNTDANGQSFAALGRMQSGNFVVRGNDGATILPSCVMTFAYWNPRFLEQRQLLNSQNGEYLNIETSPPVREELEVRGELQTALRYRLAAGKLNLELWYSQDQQWLGLESTTESGRILRYELL